MAKSKENVEEFMYDDSFCKLVIDPDAETLEKWKRYRQNNPDKVEAMEEAKQIVLMLRNDSIGVEPDERIASVWQKLQSSIDENHKPKEFSIKKNSNWKLWKVAAVIALLIGTVFILTEIVNDPEVEIKLAKANQFTKSTPMGQKTTVYLPDGSQVMMNAGSTIEYYEDQKSNTRKLILEGEAFFDIKRDTLRLFTVNTENINTTVLGTSFNIRAYKGENEIEVALVSGKVSLTNNSSPSQNIIALLPNDMVSYRKAEKTILKSNFDPEKVLAWTDKTLYFEDVNFEQLMVTLERWYGVDFVIDNDLWKNKKFIERKDYRGKYKNKSLETVLEAVSFSYGFDFEIDNKTVRINLLKKKGGIN
ncbi:FecR domain-containing protein [Reichenbachiella sp. MALMAid0571]|uniref:FecR family protein n=1 Tax=Reichenbachiella sp. MALMAid0571 TaxID=3143939 RepID=UPI0032DF589B